MKINQNYALAVDAEKLKNKIDEVKEESKSLQTQAVYDHILNMVDLTTLTETDNELKIKDMCEKVNNFNRKFPHISNVAAICVYPAMVPYVKQHLNADKIGIASVGGGFPASQTFTSIKVEECKMAVEAGATEVDIVIPVGAFLAGNDELLFEETKSIKEAIGDTHLKVILETGDLEPEQIRKASLLAMEAGADFIKTSTGKVSVSATHEAMYIMCEAIKDYYQKTGRKVGVKPAGGVREVDDAVIYYAIVKKVLGEAWLNNELFRFGASSLANKVIQAIEKDESIKYF